jgi:hypothetical protein
MIAQTVPTSAEYPDAQSKIDLGRQFMQGNKLAMDMFVVASKKDILYEVDAAGDFWLDNVIDANGTTIRDFVISSINIWGIAL